MWALPSATRETTTRDATSTGDRRADDGDARFTPIRRIRDARGRAARASANGQRRDAGCDNSDIGGVRSRRVATRETRDEDAGEARCSR